MIGAYGFACALSIVQAQNQYLDVTTAAAMAEDLHGSIISLKRSPVGSQTP